MAKAGMAGVGDQGNYRYRRTGTKVKTVQTFLRVAQVSKEAQCSFQKVEGHQRLQKVAPRNFRVGPRHMRHPFFFLPVSEEPLQVQGSLCFVFWFFLIARAVEN